MCQKIEESIPRRQTRRESSDVTLPECPIITNITHELLSILLFS